LLALSVGVDATGSASIVSAKAKVDSRVMETIALEQQGLGKQPDRSVRAASTKIEPSAMRALSFARIEITIGVSAENEEHSPATIKACKVLRSGRMIQPQPSGTAVADFRPVAFARRRVGEPAAR
jgi:hypothetical protein